MYLELLNQTTHWLMRSGLTEELAGNAAHGLMLIPVAIVAFIAYAIVRIAVVRTAVKIAAKTKVTWDDQLVASGFFARLAHIVPLTIIQWLGALLVSSGGTETPLWFDAILQAYLLLILIGLLTALLTATQLILAETRAGTMPLKGLIQAARLTIYVIGAILLLSILLGRSPVFFFSGLTALTAVTMLIFKDAILGFVAGIQISANQMIKLGDWIEMPQQGADGFVIDVSLTTVKVQNWDKTISTIPTYALISESFKNWRGMFESGGRRIKRALHIDMQTVRFADEEMLKSWQKILLLRPYLKTKLAEIAADHETIGEDSGILGNGRRLTNLGTFRAYCSAYLRANPEINQEMIFLIRHLQPTEHGIPVEIYVFTKDTRWVVHESVQADIFDHLLAMLPQFGLRTFQVPSGNDLRELKR
ncbi:MAG: mechanosensitive ion channel domain-containing protein [Kiritimatiellales bacterium]